MNAMGCHPADGAALQCETGADGEEIFDPFVSLVSAMSEQTVIAHADTKRINDPPKQNAQRERLPAEKEECRNSTDVQDCQKEKDDRINGLSKSAVALQKAH